MRAALLLTLVSLAAAAGEKADLTPRPLTLLFAGGSAGEAQTPALTALRERLAGLDAKSTVVVFTGNYLQGELPEKGEPGRAEAERALLAHVEATKDFFARGGRVYFLPGHTDFAAGGTKAVRRMRKLLNGAFAGDSERDGPRGRAPEGRVGEWAREEDIDVMPAAACGETTEVKLTDVVGLLLVNSQWWMQQDGHDPNFNDACVAKTERAFDGNIADTMRGWRGRRLVVASHHPLRSFGEYGGAFTGAAHLDPGLVAGTAWVIARQAGLVPQYQSYPQVQSYVRMLQGEASRYGAFVFASGHDASLQYLRVDAQAQVIAGTTASSGARVVQPSEPDFAAAAPGWAELQLAADGEGTVRLVSASGEPLFFTLLPSVVPLVAEPEASPPPPLPAAPVEATYSKRPVWNLPRAVTFFVGSYYADAFQLQQPYGVLDLETFAGGLEPYKVGGGQQSNSLRAHDPEGGDWAIRSTTKDSSRLLAYPLNRVAPLTRGLEHGFTATQPEAALATARLADAAGVLSVHPQLLYVPDQPALGPYRGFVTNEVVLVEQRPSEMNDGVTAPAYLGGRGPKTRFEGYDDLLEKLDDKPGKHRVDQREMLRARLLDMVVGDWDRHRSQWRFAGNETEDKDVVWTPVALDRDQALAQYDGVGLRIVQLMFPQARSLQPFTGHYGSLRWLNYNARDVDARLLNGLDHVQWMQVAHEVQSALTDDAIDDALATWHPNAWVLDGARIAEALKQRRDGLLPVAEEAYRRQARNVDVVGSTRGDRFDVTFAADGTVQVAVSYDGKGKPFYDRAFRPDETDELRLYGLDGDDTLEVHGTPDERIALRFVGGEGHDAVKGSGDARAISLYDREQGATVDPRLTVTDERSELARLGQYEPRENHEPDTWAVTPGLAYNPDQGVYLGGTYVHVVPGFKREPFAVRHTGSAYFATATLGVALDYQALLPQSIEGFDQQVDLRLHTPQFTRNFFGLTNAYRGANEPADRYRVRQALYEARYGIAYGFGGVRSRVGVQLVGQAIDTERTAGRYIESAPDVSTDTFGTRGFIGARLFAETNTFDSLTLPRRGIALHASVEGRCGIGRACEPSSNHVLAAATAIPLGQSQRFVILSRARLEGVVGPHPFYFAATLGAPQVRGYSQGQLAGDVSFAHSTDLRVDVLRIESVLPGTIGVNASFDHGRVWGSTIASNAWHASVGGGIWWSIVDLVGVQLSYHRGLDGGERFMAAVGPLFAETGF